MDLRDYFNILFILLLTASFSFSQVTEVRCINPKFDELVDGYLDYSIPAISVADAYDAREDYIFLDARELDEYNIAHINNAIPVGYDDFQISKVESGVPKDSKIIIYCSIGYRSEKIGNKLKKNGYQHVYNLYGSIFEWVNQHHPVYNKEGQLTSKLHTFNKKWSKWVENEGVDKIWD